MIQIYPKIQQLVSFAATTQMWPMMGHTDIANSVRSFPVPWATTVRNLTVSSGDTTRTMDLTVTVVKNEVETDLEVVLPFVSSGPVTDTTHDVVCAQFDRIKLQTHTSAGSPGNTIGWCVEYESAGNIFGIARAGASFAQDHGFYGGALGNGLWAVWDVSQTSVSATYSICSVAGSITTLVMDDTYVDPVPPGCSLKGYVRLKKPSDPLPVIQDGSGGTVDTLCEITAGNVNAASTFDLPIEPGDVVELVFFADGGTVIADVAMGLGFMPTTPGQFMLTGGSNNAVWALPGYVWDFTAQNETDEALTAAPVGPSGFVGLGLYTVGPAPGSDPAEQVTDTVRRSGADTALTVTRVQLETEALIEGLAVPFVEGDTIDIINSAGPDGGNGSRLYWGLAATLESAAYGTIIVTKEAGDDVTTEFDFETVGLTPSTFSLVGGASQTFTLVPEGDGYEVSETLPEGWSLVSATVSNGSPIDDIEVAADETVTIVFVNSTRPATERSGSGGRFVRRRLRRAPHLSSEQFVQFFSLFQLDLQAGVGLNDGQGEDAIVNLRWSDDGGFTWSNYHAVSAGRMGQYSKRAIWRRLGRGRDRIFEVSMSDPVKWILVDAYLQASKGTS